MSRTLSILSALVLVLALAGCSSLPMLAPPASGTTATARHETVFVASVRAREAGGAFGSERSEAIAYASYDVSIPPSHVPGSEPQAGSVRPDPARHFAIVGQQSFGSPQTFESAVVSHAQANYGAPAEAIVFVHGFNTSHVDAVYQLAQIGSDLHIPATKILYSWPSNQRLLDYVHDLDSAAFARDGLQRLLEDLAAAGVRRIVVAGYSMGAAIVVETLRQMKLEGSGEVFARLGGVVLLSPDMDIDLFRIAGERMDGLPQPFVIYSAPQERAFGALSDFVTAGKPRLGALPDPNALAGLNLIFVDVGEVPQSRQRGHLPVATSAGMIAAINSLPRADLIAYAELAARGGVAGAAIRQFGGLTYVVLPGTVR